MELDPHIKLVSLLVAIPSSALVFDRLGIPVKGNENRTLQEVCVDRNVSMDRFWRALDEIDWSKESPTSKDT